MKRSKHSLSHYKLLSCSPGELVPITCFEVLPGDTLQHAVAMLIRTLPLVAPVMHPLQARVHTFFCPYRLVWPNFEPFITGGPDGNDATVPPTITTPGGGFAVGSLADYLGVPPSVAGVAVSALPFRAYALIFNEWYRDQDLQTPLVISTGDGNDTTTSTALVNVAWEKDYFTSARPWEQKGPSVSIPLTGDAPVKGIGKDNLTIGENNANTYETGDTAGTPSTFANSTLISQNAAANHARIRQTAAGVPDIYADLSSVTAATINDLRLAMALQRYEEARARYGSRYVEYLRYLGVRSSDARLQRPEYLGGGKQTIQFSEVLQTSPTTDGDDSEGVGNLKGHGIGAMRSRRYRRYFEEHGLVISLLSVKPRTMYTQGLHRMWSRTTKEEYFQLELQHIGQQAILNKEVYMAGASPNEVFGYQDRYDEYRRMESSVAGEFRTTLDYWHMARVFSSAPALNASFVSSNPTTRIYAITDSGTDKLYVMANHSIQARRLISAKGTSFGL